MATRDKVYIDIVADNQKALKSMAGLATGIMAVVKTWQKLKDLAIESYKAFETQERATLKLEAILKSTGGAAGWTAAELNRMAESLDRVTSFSDDAITNAQALLATFTAIAGEAFPRATKTVLDMSEAFDQSLKISAIQLGKALQDPIKGLTALGRVGVDFSEEQKELVRGFMEVNDLGSAQEVIFDALDTQTGNVATTMGTAAGSLGEFADAILDLKESGGEFISNTLGPLINKLTDFLNQRNDMADMVKQYDAFIEAGGKLENLDMFNSNTDALEIFNRLIVLNRKEIAELEIQATQGSRRSREEALEKIANGEMFLDHLFMLRDGVERLMTAEAVAAAEAADAARDQAALDLEEANRQQDLQDYLDRVNLAYSKTTEGRLANLQSNIDYYKIALPFAGEEADAIEAIIKLLEEQIDNLDGTTTALRDQRLEDEKLETQQRNRLSMIQDYRILNLEGIDQEIARNNAAMQAELERAEEFGLTYDEKMAIVSYFNDKETEIREKYADEERERLKELKDEYKESKDAKLKILEDALQDRLDKWDEFYKEIREKSERKAKEAEIIADLETSYRIRAMEDGLEKEQEIMAQRHVEELAEAKEAGADITDLLVAQNAERNELIADADEEAAEAKRELWRDNLDAFSDITDAMFDIINAFHEREQQALISSLEDETDERLTTLEDQYDKDIAAAKAIGADTTAIDKKYADDKVAIQDDLAEKKGEILTEEAMRKRKQAIFSIAVDTASAIAEALPNIPLSILAGVLGLAQGIAVAATPIPAFATGGDFITSGEQIIKVGDNAGGRERVTVEPLSSPNINGPSGDNSTIYNIINVDGEKLWEGITKASRNKKILIHAGSIVS